MNDLDAALVAPDLPLADVVDAGAGVEEVSWLLPDIPGTKIDIGPLIDQGDWTSAIDRGTRGARRDPG